LTLQASGASPSANANLTFNLNTAVAGQANKSTPAQQESPLG